MILHVYNIFIDPENNTSNIEKRKRITAQVSTRRVSYWNFLHLCCTPNICQRILSARLFWKAKWGGWRDLDPPGRCAGTILLLGRYRLDTIPSHQFRPHHCIAMDFRLAELKKLTCNGTNWIYNLNTVFSRTVLGNIAKHDRRLIECVNLAPGEHKR